MSRAQQPNQASAQPRFKPYPVYKTGVEWLGDIPEGWKAHRLKTLISDPITDGPHETPEFLIDGVPFLSVDGIQGGELVFNACRYISEDAHRAYQRKCAPRRDDILLGKAASTGKIARVKVDLAFSIWSPLALIRPNQARIWPAYLEYFLKGTAAQAQIDVLCTSNTQKNISMGDIPILVVCRPSLDEQRAIAAFLDRETARIDALVAKKERLIELLQEKRAALITRTVTKGLDPNAPMRDSGVEWLGEIPAHWDAERIKWRARMVSGHTPDKKVESYWVNGDIPWVSLADTKQLREVDHIASTEVMTTSDGILHSSAHVLPSGTVVFSRDATIGLCAILRAGMAVSQHFIGWVCGSQLRPEYLLFVLRSMTQELQRLTMGSTVLTIGMPDVKSLATPIPPLPEQDEIVRYVLDGRAQLDLLVTKIHYVIERLKEFRAALISAAVTGKIDVREAGP